MEAEDAFVGLLQKWNRSIRLVGDSGAAALVRHIEDARALLPFLPESGRLVDVGSGNGLPAIPVALARPQLEVTLVEPVAKKVAFLRACRRELNLANVTVIRARDDELLERRDFRPYDVAISQATFAPPDWLERGMTLVKPGGFVIAMLGDQRDAVRELDSDVRIHELSTSDERTRALAVRRRPPND